MREKKYLTEQERIYYEQLLTAISLLKNAKDEIEQLRGLQNYTSSRHYNQHVLPIEEFLTKIEQ